MIEEQLQEIIQEKAILKTENIELKNEVENLKGRNQYLAEEYQRLLTIIKIANRSKYGSKSERYQDISNGEQLSLLDTIETVAVEATGDETETITYKRKKRTRKDQIQNLPRREVIIAVPGEERKCTCGKEKQLIGYETKEKIHYQPAVFEIVEEKREVLGCPAGCAGSVVTAEAVKTALPKVKASEELLSHIAVSKILDRQPLYHLEKQFETRYQVYISRQTMARWMIEMSRILQPIINLLKDSLLSYDIGGLDATTLQVLKEPDRLATRKSYAYCIRGGAPGKEVVLYEYNARDHKQFLADYFLGFSGTLHVDADSFFEDLPDKGTIILSYCNAHARRKFEQIVKATRKGGLAKQVVLKYQEIYKIEKEAKELKLIPEERYKLRQEKIKPLMEELKHWLEEHYPKVLPKSPIGQAIKYCLKHWSGLMQFLEDGRLEIDNNLTEQQIKYL